MNHINVQVEMADSPLFQSLRPYPHQEPSQGVCPVTTRDDI